MPASKSGATIIINGSPNTLSSVTSDINDTSWIEESPAGTWTVKDKNIQVQDGGVFTMGDSGDYSVAEKLVMDPLGNDTCRIDTNRGGEFQMFGNVELDANLQAPSYYQRWRWYGKFYCRGNATYTPYIYHLYLIWRYRMSFAGDGDDRNHDINDVDYLKVDTWYNTASKWEQPSMGRVFADYNVEKIRNVTFGKSGDPAGHKVIEVTNAQANNCGDDYSKILWEDCIFQYQGTSFALYPYYAHIKDCQFIQNTAYAITVYFPTVPTGLANPGTELYRDYTIPMYAFVEGCSFSPSYSRDILVQWGGALLIKSCTFNAANENIWVQDGGKLYVWTGNTFNGSTPIYRNYANSCVFYVFALDLTVETTGGAPIENALVYIRQKDGKEVFVFRTDANGKPRTMAALEGKIMLTHKEHLDNTPTYELWSDPSNSTYHDIVIWKQGYEPKTYQWTMDQDRQVTAQLVQLGQPEARIEHLPLEGTLEEDVGLTGELQED